MPHTAAEHPDLPRLRELGQAQQALRRSLLEIARLSEQQCHVPADRPDALLMILDRKQRLLRELCEMNAPALFRDCAGLANGDGEDDRKLSGAKAHLRAEAAANIGLWQQVVESEERARVHCAACVQELGKGLAAAQRKDEVARTYGAPSAGEPAVPRFLDRVG